MNIVVCPHCHIHLRPAELEEAVSNACHYLICPECDEPLPIPDGEPNPPDPGGDGTDHA